MEYLIGWTLIKVRSSRNRNQQKMLSLTFQKGSVSKKVYISATTTFAHNTFAHNTDLSLNFKPTKLIK